MPEADGGGGLSEGSGRFGPKRLVSGIEQELGGGGIMAEGILGLSGTAFGVRMSCGLLPEVFAGSDLRLLSGNPSGCSSNSAHIVGESGILEDACPDADRNVRAPQLESPEVCARSNLRLLSGNSSGCDRESAHPKKVRDLINHETLENGKANPRAFKT